MICGEGNGNSLLCSCLENPTDRVAGGLQSMGSQRIGHDFTHTHNDCQQKITQDFSSPSGEGAWSAQPPVSVGLDESLSLKRVERARPSPRHLLSCWPGGVVWPLDPAVLARGLPQCPLPSWAPRPTLQRVGDSITVPSSEELSRP